MPRSLEGLYDELLRVRERVHKLAETVAVNRMQIEAHAKLMDEITDKVSKMETADVIATEVAKRVSAMDESRREQHGYRLTAWQIRIAILAAFVAVIVPVVNIILIGVRG